LKQVKEKHFETKIRDAHGLVSGIGRRNERVWLRMNRQKWLAMFHHMTVSNK